MIPDQFIERMRALLGDEADAFFAALEHEPQIGLRANTLKIDPQDLQQHVSWPLRAVPWCPVGFYAPHGSRPGKHPYHAAGLYYLQEPSAMAVAEALDVQPGQRVLDLAAAPGGKATHIAALLDDQGLLVANEIDGGRVKVLGENLERWGARNVIITSDSPDRLSDCWGAAFDRVLLDAPCSGEGMFRKNPVAQAEWSLGHVEGCAVRQARILDHAARLVKQGGLLVYSTCTFAPEENEQRIATFLAKHDGWELIDLPKHDGFAPARPEWAEPIVQDLQHAVRLWPHRLRGEGHFIAALRRVGPQPPRTDRQAVAPSRRKGSQNQRPGTQPAWNVWQAFAQTTLRLDMPVERLHVANDQIYFLPADHFDLGDVRIVRRGLWLGTLKPGRFVPSHALALALRANEAQTTLDLSPDEAVRYLRGETIDRGGPGGWVLVTVDGWSLGWGRRTGDIVKNHYPKGLRWMSR